jgi:hypothetical protein
MNRALLVLNGILVVSLGVLWVLDASLEARREGQRAADSAFHALSEPDPVKVADVTRIALTLPGAGTSSGTEWMYVRRGDGWHLPQHRDGFGIGQEIEGFLKALLESRGTVVGRVPADLEHFGISAGRTVEAKLYDSTDELLLHALCGSVAPGQRSTESFLTATGRDTILEMRSNPHSYIQWDRQGGLPPLLDTRVIPLALGRGLPSKISFSGEGAPAVREMLRRDIPMERRLAARFDRGPNFEWFGTTAGGETRINDDVSSGYVSFLSSLVFDELLGPRTRSGLNLSLEKPSLAITIEYDGGPTDTLRGWQEAGGARYHLHHSATDQVFVISEEKAKKLVPDAKALLELPAPRSASQDAAPGLPLPPGLPQPGEK